MDNKSERYLFSRSLTSSLYYPTAMTNTCAISESYLRIDRLPNIEHSNETNEMIFSNFDYVVQSRHSRELTKVKMGRLYIEYQLSGKGSCNVLIKLINPPTGSINTLLELEIGRYNTDFKFDMFMPFCLGALEGATGVGKKSISRLSYEELNQRLCCTKIQEHIVNLCLDHDVEPELFNRDLTNFVNFYGKNIISYQLLPISNINSNFFSSVPEKESPSEDIDKFRTKLLLDAVKIQTYFIPCVRGFGLKICEENWPIYKPKLDILTEVTDSFINNQINQEDFINNCKEIFDSCKEFDLKICQETPEKSSYSKGALRYINQFIRYVSEAPSTCLIPARLNR
jgi:hypothetical protein